MKAKSFLSSLILSFSILFVTISCDKDDDSGDKKSSITGKWDVSATNSGIKSLEFTSDGKYILNEGAFSTTISKSSKAKPTSESSFLKKAKPFFISSRTASNLSPIHFGTYKIEGNKIVLTGYGVVEVIKITETDFTFSFALEKSADKKSYVATKSKDAISATNKTNLFCNTWILEKAEYDFSKLTKEEIDLIKTELGNNWQSEKNAEISESLKNYGVLFSKAGTYLVFNSSDDSANLAEWKWTDSTEQEIYYSWDNWLDNYQEDSKVKIVQLDSKTLVLKEDDMTYYLKTKN